MKCFIRKIVNFVRMKIGQDEHLRFQQIHAASEFPNDTVLTGEFELCNKHMIEFLSIDSVSS